jgi:hypothetical protein
VVFVKGALVVRDVCFAAEMMLVKVDDRFTSIEAQVMTSEGKGQSRIKCKMT